MAIDRTALNALVDDTGLNLDGSIVNKAMLASVIFDPIDAALLAQGVEIGSWTPAFYGSGGQSGQTYGTQTGRYWKSGQHVLATYTLVLTAIGTITGNLQVGGLPYLTRSTSNVHTTTPTTFGSMNANFVQINTLIVPNSLLANVLGITAAAATNNTSLTQADMTATSYMIGSINYLSNA